MATEEILMAAVAAGGDRQALHESIRVHSQAAAAAVKQEGQPNDLIERLSADPAFAGVDLSSVLDARKFTGRAAEQVDHFLATAVAAVRARYAGRLGRAVSLRV